RPLVGPVVPLTVLVSGQNELLGAGPTRPAASDPVATRVLMKGEPIPAASGRADDFSWPRNSVVIVDPPPPAVAAEPPPPPARGQAAGSKAGAGKQAPAAKGQRAPAADGAPRPPAPIRPSASVTQGLFR